MGCGYGGCKDGRLGLAGVPRLLLGEQAVYSVLHIIPVHVQQGLEAGMVRLFFGLTGLPVLFGPPIPAWSANQLSQTFPIGLVDRPGDFLPHTTSGERHITAGLQERRDYLFKRVPNHLRRFAAKDPKRNAANETKIGTESFPDLAIIELRRFGSLRDPEHRDTGFYKHWE